MIKDFPCKITEISISKTGKHGHAKAHVFGNDIFTGKKYEDVFPTSHNVDAPVVNKVEVEVVSIEEGSSTTWTTRARSSKSSSPRTRKSPTASRRPSTTEGTSPSPSSSPWARSRSSPSERQRTKE